MSPLSLLFLSTKLYRPARMAAIWLSFHYSRLNKRMAAQKERGQGMVEYALILTLVAIVVIIILALLGPSLQRVYAYVYCSVRQPDLGFEFYDAFYIDEHGVCTEGEPPE